MVGGMSKQSKIKRVKYGMAARQLFIPAKDFDESLSVAIDESENLMASGSNFVVVRKEFLIRNPNLSRKTKCVAVVFESPEGPITYDFLRRDQPHFPNFEHHFNVNRVLLLSGVDMGTPGYWINQVPNSETPDHYCLSPPARFSGI